MLSVSMPFYRLLPTHFPLIVQLIGELLSAGSALLEVASLVHPHASAYYAHLTLDSFKKANAKVMSTDSNPT